MGAKKHSFNDLSMGAHEDEEEYSKRKSTDEEPNSPTAQSGSPSLSRRSSSNKQVWQSVWNPGRNYNDNYKTVGNQYYDHVDKTPGNTSVWDHILRSERIKAFKSFDRDGDGFITADELKMKLGSQADVSQLIAAADKNGDGKIDYSEFCELVRNA
ncbi:hypothetical protein WJX73_007722 [Symbiochloris irregularis]|uniref:EF-hand domain-containing protein n=1 Tax=Symbiochloris irregularis TaxID=706552 RepID=A0AAW1NII3_9CHLO